MAENEIQQVANVLAEADSVLFITGAGVSADSGLPTYRGVGGLYNDDETEDGVAIEDALSGPMFAAQPALTWKYLWQIASACRRALPNPAHNIIAEIESKKREVWVVTQNVDGLHRAAGSKNLVEVHGHIYDLFCAKCGFGISATELLGNFKAAPDLPPICSKCGGVIRPRVVLFEESLPMRVVHSLDQLAFINFDLVVAVGTTAVFPYIREPIRRAQRANSPTVEINPTETAVSQEFDYRIQSGAAHALERIWSCTNQR